MRIALCSTDTKKVDGNFNKSDNFLIYDVAEKEIKFTGIRKPESIKSPLDVDQIDRRIDRLSDCKMIFCLGIPKASSARLINRGIFAVRIRTLEYVSAFLEKFMCRIKNNPLPAIKKY